MSVIFLPSASYFCHLRPIKNYWSAVSSASWGLVMHMGITGILTSQKWGSCPSLHSASMHTRSSAARVWYPHMHEASEYWGVLLLYLEVYFFVEKNTSAVSLDINCRRKRNMFGDTYFEWSICLKVENPKNQRAFFTGKEFISHFSLTIDSFFFFSSLVSFLRLLILSFFWLIFLSLSCVIYTFLCLGSVSLSCVRLSIQTNDFGL